MGPTKYGLYVDNVPVPGSGRQTLSTANENSLKHLSLSGITGMLAAGEHKISIRYDCLQGPRARRARIRRP